MWQLADIAAKGGNLLLNVGPRGVDAQIPDEQLARLDWLGDWMGRCRAAVVATRPWITPGTMSGDAAVRYTTREDTVFAFVRDAAGSVTLPDLRATSTTTVVDIGGSPREWRDSPLGISVELPPAPSGAEPAVLALNDVVARSTGRLA